MRFLILLSCVLLACPVAVGAQVIYSDGDFDDSNWTTTVITLNHAGGSTAHEFVGGNPDQHRTIHVLRAEGTRPSKVMVVELWGEHYDATTQGSILELFYREDQKCASVDGCVGGGQGWYPALYQNGRYYIHNPGIDTGVLNSWVTRSVSGLEAIDFGEVMLTAAGLLDTASNPDFSSTGPPIRFGYARANSFSSDRTGRIDNWYVEVTSITLDERLFDLLQVVEGLTEPALKNGNGKALSSKLYSATKQLAKGNTSAALADLQAFIQLLQNLVAVGNIDSSVATHLIAKAQAIIDTIEASGKAALTAEQPGALETNWGNLKTLYR